MEIRPFHSQDSIAKLRELINRAYRGSEGERRWTTEQHLVAGDRLSEAGLLAMLEDADVQMLVAQEGERLVGCIAAKSLQDCIELGCFAIEPALHGMGLGKQLLHFAEQQFAARSDGFQVTVVSLNQDLIAFYERRGYQPTGHSIPYPLEQNVGIPKVAGIELVVLRKPVRT